MSREAPWDDIRLPSADYNVRLVSGGSQTRMYWGRDSEGHCLFIVELEGDNTAAFMRSDVSIRGIDIDLRTSSLIRGQSLVLTLEQQADRDLFLGLCETLTDSLSRLCERSAALDVTLMHLKRWQAFLAGQRKRTMSQEELRGLFGELQFLRALCRHLSPTPAVMAWCGPEGGQQDFVFSNTAVEVKAVSGIERRSVRISSEDQLESMCDHLFLTIYLLVDKPESDKALSLNDVVNLLDRELVEPVALEEFWSRLGSYGYAELRDYDSPRLVVARQHVFAVAEGFPSLLRSRLPLGIANVTYDIQLEHAIPYECGLGEIWRAGS